MYKVGITGGIGCGKTTVSKLFKELGVPVFNSDLSAREAENDKYIQEQFNIILCDNVFVDGVVNRDKMRQIIFNDKNKLSQINQLIIPYVRNSFNNFVNQNRRALYVLLESAILFETNSEKSFESIITVTADLNIRKNRVLKRDNISEDMFNSKLANQLSETEKIQRSDFIVNNNGVDLLDSLKDLTEQVSNIHDTILKYQVIKSGINQL